LQNSKRMHLKIFVYTKWNKSINHFSREKYFTE
jgi:hypothetical protein